MLTFGFLYLHLQSFENDKEMYLKSLTIILVFIIFSVNLSENVIYYTQLLRGSLCFNYIFKLIK